MAGKDDILEQVAKAYMLNEGYCVQHNLKFRPRKDHPDFDPAKDSNPSDINVIGYNPCKSDEDRVVVVTCRSWQGGFDPKSWVDAIKEDKKVLGRGPGRLSVNS